ncbi:class E vacuolar protein-sorting machinery protein hse1 [Nannizzia gypsea CBS 118893]|uniref:Class E vacuolar protein-sorting machinery protein HSE1 n=1 Tax=Arthroderma gypseum (strain ATCC MYA-4604 / CBS 118893) TaxID=535722 RepID=E4V4Q3_ARTGP|nr:class E vacuolar protein-sorting machinery protein hse1 [Nannizzia gypsea CBS 118893]EFR04977.1 class E vacuolar protein-sorting machinery protein hse1 [Nannizzia gypsea CBS 118893]
MFRVQQNSFDDAVAKATDENLTSENWEYILDVCDKVSSDSSGAKDAVAALIRRLAHRNANVQLYTLELANALSQNCGQKVYQELASKSFTDALLRLANDRNTHQQVKSKILEHIEQWTEMFSSNPDLGIMEQAYLKLKSQNPNLQPPSKPTKREITELDRLKEEEELQMALALSVKDKQPATDQQPSNSGESSQQTSAAGPSNTTSTSQPTPIASGTTAATVSRVRALYDFQPSEPGELQFRKGDVIAVLESVYKDWWKGSLRGQTGIFPLNYVEKLSDPTQEELQREAQMEAEVFAEIKNVEKLLALLSTSNSELNVQENEEITTLYHSTLAIRPKLIELIGKYSKKKDDFTQLNEKFIKARRDYEALLETSMAHPGQPQFGRPPPQATYGYPPPGVQQYPPGPSQPDQRYFTPRPGAQNAPPSNDPSAYYGAGAEQSGPPYPSAASPENRNRTPVPGQQGQDAYSNPQTQYTIQTKLDQPQELSTSAYDSPQTATNPNARLSYHAPMHESQPSTTHPQHYQHQQPPVTYPPPGTASAPAPDFNNQPVQTVPPGSNPQYPPPQDQSQQQPQHGPPPTHQPPSIPQSTSPQPGYPSYPAPVPSAPGAPTGYQPYHPQQQPGGPANPNANPGRYYR